MAKDLGSSWEGWHHRQRVNLAPKFLTGSSVQSARVVMVVLSVTFK